MRKNSILLIALVALTFGLTSCKKYEEGPGISFRSKTARLTGDWEVTKYTMDDKDQLHPENFELETDVVTTTSELEVQMTFKDNGVFESQSDLTITVIFNGQTTSNTESSDVIGQWEFDDKKEKLLIEHFEDNEKITQELTIVRLKKDELILEGEMDQKPIRIEMTKI